MEVEVEDPWNVDTLEEFLYYCCPECKDERIQNKEDFIKHALEVHPKSKVSVSKIIQVKKESSIDIENECDTEYFVKNENNEQPVKTYSCNFCNKFFNTFKEHWDWHNSGTNNDVKTEPCLGNEEQSNDQYDDSIVQEESYDISNIPKEIRRKVSTIILIHTYTC